MSSLKMWCYFIYLKKRNFVEKEKFGEKKKVAEKKDFGEEQFGGIYNLNAYCRDVSPGAPHERIPPCHTPHKHFGVGI